MKLTSDARRSITLGCSGASMAAVTSAKARWKTQAPERGARPTECMFVI